LAEPVNTDVPIRIGYARCSTAQQEPQTQLDALDRARCTRVFSEKLSTSIKIRPELEKALVLAHDIKQAAPDQPVLLTVHEMKRLARNAAELMALWAQLQAGGTGLELLTGPLTGVYDPNGMGSMLFAVCAVAAQLDRNYIREKTLEGQQVAASKGNHGGRPKSHRRRHAAVRPSPTRPRNTNRRHRPETQHQDRQERWPAPLRRLALPGTGRVTELTDLTVAAGARFLTNTPTCHFGPASGVPGRLSGFGDRNECGEVSGAVRVRFGVSRRLAGLGLLEGVGPIIARSGRAFPPPIG
jgi:DNA invertase Pin-like site-specific DNA recombinase